MRTELEVFREGLMQQRDELRVQAHLAKLEAMEEWEQAEKKLNEMERRLAELSDEAREASDDVWASVKMLGEEIGNAYERIRRHI
jgi:ABC-type Fe3+-hydroxamate transport system substrate-binding protein